METKIDALISYFATNGTLADAIALAQTVAAQAWGDVAKLFNVMLG